MKRILGFFTLVTALVWPGLVMGQDYSFGGSGGSGYSGASSGGSAGKTGFYLAPRLLDSLTNTGDISGGDRSSKTRNTFGGALAAGYYLNRLDPRLPFRAELEYAARGDVRASWDRGSVANSGLKALFNVQTIQANLYWDIDTGTAFTPFLGGGMCMSFIYADYTHDTPAGRRSISDYNTSFAWNVGGGVAYDINEMLTVDLAYRFAGFGYAEATSGDGAHPRNYMTANEFLLGLRLKF
jgi:opacity protein-like surface antigen